MAAELRWIRSSYSGGTANSSCVECAGNGRSVWIRDSKDRHGPLLEVPLVNWRAFLTTVVA